MFDLLIRGAKVLDGTGNPGYFADVGVIDDKISFVGKCDRTVKSVIEIDGKGYCLSPGFIDSHAHDERCVFFDNRIFNKLSQGVTTTISGNCGTNIVPCSEMHFEELRQTNTVGIPERMNEFTSFRRFLDIVDEQKTAINVGFLAAHNAIRIAVMGLENRHATADEIKHMEEYLKEALDSGALGLSAGLFYPPGGIAHIDELVALCRIVADYGRIFAIHIRDEASQLVESVEEAIELGRRSGVFVNISHHKAMGQPNWGKVKQTLRMIDDANKNGIEIGFDQYPYNAASAPLRGVLPPSYLRSDWPTLVANLRRPEFREKAKADILAGSEIWDNYIVSVGFDRMLVMTAVASPDAVGKTISEYAEMKGIDPFDAIFEILADNELVAVGVYFSISDVDIEEVMKNPYGMFGSDGIYPPSPLRAHPRVKGTFPRILGRYVRDKGILRIEEAIRKMTSLPAQRFGLQKKGLIKQGFDADLVIFDSKTIIDCADFVHDCYAPNIGLAYVIVNGKIAFNNNQYTGTQSGKVIRAIYSADS
ncbi:MAG TPA: D-aminoacylase [Negativicutes bacterium]|nr:D-aminoacylase [Negativicutes bacterium]